MGRKWANIVAKKTAKDANNSRIYAKFGIEIYAAAKSGDPDPHANQKLRFVIDRAKTYNVPKHIIDRAIEKAKGAGDSWKDAITLKEGETFPINIFHYDNEHPNGIKVDD